MLLALELLLSFLATVAVTFVTCTGSSSWMTDLSGIRENAGRWAESLGLNNSVFALVFFVAFFWLLRDFFKHFEARRGVIAAIPGFLFALMILFGKNILETDHFLANARVTLLCVLALLFPFTAAVDLLFRLFQSAASRTAPLTSSEIDHKKALKVFLIVWAVLFVVWIPSLLASYPGVYGYDSIFQINQYRYHTVNLHHPIAHTYLLGFFVITVGEWLHSYEAGMFCYSIFQMICFSASLSALYAFYIGRRAPKWLRVVVLILFAFFPLNPIMAFSSTKDILFSAFFVLFALLFLLFLEKPERMRSIKMDVLFVATAFLIVVFRSQGGYIIVGTLLLTVLVFRRYWKNLLIMLGSLLALIMVYNGPVTKALGCTPVDSLKEMMSVPCVQLSRVALYHGDTIEPEQLDLIKEYIPSYEVYGVNAGISDQMKAVLNTDRLKENPLEFIKLYCSVGLKHPGAYVNAFLRITVGYWYPDTPYPDPAAYHPYWEYCSTGVMNGPFDQEAYLLLKQTPVKGFEWLYKIYVALTYHTVYRVVPVVSMLFSSGLPLWGVLFYTAYVFYRKQYRYLIVSLYLLLFYGTLFLGPVVLYRYIYPAVLCTPLLFACVFSLRDKGWEKQCQDTAEKEPYSGSQEDVKEIVYG